VSACGKKGLKHYKDSVAELALAATTMAIIE